jgi:L-histidine N-alpha-methyltransferase
LLYCKNRKALKEIKYDSNVEAASTCDLDKFRADVLSGLSLTPKRLSSKYFYDKKGDELFQRIMECPEYYLTRCELEIFQWQTNQLATRISGKSAEPFDLIELGVGDGTKTRFLLNELIETKTNFNYLPIDISGNILSELEHSLSHLDSLNITLLQGEYLDMLKEASRMSGNRKVVLFLGGNIGNMDIKEAKAFCQNVRSMLLPGDLFIIGFDLRKDPHRILNAYNDKLGITRKFNLNLLQRINKELDANFEIDKFAHYPTYDPHTGACKSYLVSSLKQDVRIGDTVIPFQEGECVFMEISQKYSFSEIELLAANAGFSVIENLSDRKNWFVDSVWSASSSQSQPLSIL